MKTSQLHTNPDWYEQAKTTQWDTLPLAWKDEDDYRRTADNTTNKIQADANRDFIWITRIFSPAHCPKLIWWAPSQALPTFPKYQLLKLSTTAFLCFPFPCSHLHLLRCLCSARHFSSLPSGNRKFSQLPTTVPPHLPPPVQEATGSGWLSLNAQLQWEFVSSKQTKDAAPPPIANWRSRVSIQLTVMLGLWSWQTENNAWLTTVVNWGGLSWVIWSLLSFQVPTA